MSELSIHEYRGDLRRWTHHTHASPLRAVHSHPGESRRAPPRQWHRRPDGASFAWNTAPFLSPTPLYTLGNGSWFSPISRVEHDVDHTRNLNRPARRSVAAAPTG